MANKTVSIDTIAPDAANVRQRTKRSAEVLDNSVRQFGAARSIVLDADGIVRAGNGTLASAKAAGIKKVRVIETTGEELIAVKRTDLTGSKATAYAIADNRSGDLATWQFEDLDAQLKTLTAEGLDINELGFGGEELAELFPGAEPEPEPIVEDEVPEVPADPVTQPGDLWLLGDHRVLCGDSTKADDVARLMDGAKASMVHADPPYGMGKEKDGVLNDNLYREKLDAFQMAWWQTFRPHLENNASAYIWGNAPDLWRLWYVGGLADSERLTIRNEIIWNQPTGVSWGKDGMSSLRMFAPMGERCLFFMLGEQGFNNNADNYWEGWEPIRSYLESEMKRCGWKVADLNRITGTQMAGHWVTRSQWTLITAEHYKTIQPAAREHGAFKREHDELKREHDELKREHDELKREFYETRAYFDNTHDNMTDVWEFNRVTGEARHGHATPKPIAMVARAFSSSSKHGEVIVVPFGGSGPDFIAAEQLGRKCYGMEISPAYCDVIVKRWETLTGKTATKE